ncbi:MAG: cation:dicarboxylase symporter family transporter [Coxiellaceae bacterium]|nr:cation:dicarboxylase symporter family transporter [Coxiellaceae bacterium]
MEKNKLSWLLSPWVILASICLGLCTGAYAYRHHQQMALINSIAYIFLSLLEMCVIPLIITAVTGSFAKLLLSRHRQGIQRIIYLPVAFVVGMLATSALGIIVGRVGGVGGSIEESVRRKIGGAIHTSYSNIVPGSVDGSALSNLHSLLHTIIGNNVFKAAVNGQGITLIIFSVLLGLSLGLITSRASRATMLVFDGLFEALLRLVNGLMYLLPIGLFALFAQQVSKSGIESFIALYRLVLFIYIPCIVMLVVAVWIIARRTGEGWLRTFVHLREMMTIAFVSSNGFSALPFGLNILEKKLKFTRDDVNLLFPITISLNFVASCYLFSLMAVFMAHFYGQDLSFTKCIIVLVASVLTSIAVGSIPAIASFSMIGILFTPIGLPIGTAVAILVIISQAIDPIVTLTNVVVNAMWVAVFSDRQADEGDEVLEVEAVVAE